MKLLMKSATSYSGRLYSIGEVADLPKDIADDWCKCGVAEPLKDTRSETATAEPPETASMPNAPKRRLKRKK